MRSTMLLLGASVMLGGCGYDSDGPTYPSTPASVSLTLSSDAVLTSAGDTRTVTAVVKNADQTVVASPSLTWTTDAPAVATVTGTGATATITAVGDGVAKITAAAGSVVGTGAVTVRRQLARIVLTSPVPTLTVGSTAQLVLTGLDARGNPLTGLTETVFASSNPGSVMVSNTGVVTALFAFPALPSAIIGVTASKDGVSFADTAAVSVAAPPFDHAALMLSEYVKPARAASAGAGVVYFSVANDRINYRIVWSALSGPAREAHVHGSGTTEEVSASLVDFVVGVQDANYGALTGSFGAADIRPQGGKPAISVDSLVKLLGNGRAYVDVHTVAFPGGEIRGQVEGPFP